MSKSQAMAVIEDYVLCEAKYTQAKEEFKAARGALLALAPKEIGEHEIAEGKFKVTIKYPEKVVWDAEGLDAVFGGEKPHYVKATYSIDLRTLRTLPRDTQEELAKCKEEKPGSPSIDVEVTA